MEIATLELLDLAIEDEQKKSIKAEEARINVSHYKQTFEFFWRIMRKIKDNSYNGGSCLNIKIDDYLIELRVDMIIRDLRELGFMAELNFDSGYFEISW